MNSGGVRPAPPCIELTWSPKDTDFAAVFTALEIETAPITGPCRIEPLALLLRDPAGSVAGGLWGRVVYSWLVIEMLVVPPHMRGMGAGTALIAHAEEAARSRGCVGIHLTRLDFQAPAFYERLGFSTFGVQHDVPPGHSCSFLFKRFD
jgi:GNAT superfamily N-acetyltransferase